MEIQKQKRKNSSEEAQGVRQDTRTPARSDWEAARLRREYRIQKIQALYEIYNIGINDIIKIKNVCKNKIEKIEEEEYWRKWRIKHKLRNEEKINPNWERELDDEIQEILEKKKTKKKRYFITFTVPDKIYLEGDKKKIEVGCEKIIHKVISSKSFECTDSLLRKEYTKKMVAHWHLRLECNKYVKKQAIEKLGWKWNINIQKVRNWDAVGNYVTKEDNIIFEDDEA